MFPQGNDQRRRQVSPDQFYFNPRSRRGTIIICVFGRNVKGFQSALLQGERLSSPLYSITKIFYFNPRSRRGNDLVPKTDAATMENFNPRSRKGNDRGHDGGVNNQCNFNPRSRTGNDLYPAGQPFLYSISIHVPAGGTTGGF